MAGAPGGREEASSAAGRGGGPDRSLSGRDEGGADHEGDRTAGGEDRHETDVVEGEVVAFGSAAWKEAEGGRGGRREEELLEGP